MNSKKLKLKTINIMDVIDAMIMKAETGPIHPPIQLTPVHGWYRMEKDGSVHPIQDFAEANKDSERVLAKTKVGKEEVSTVFLGLDHNYDPNDKPILFETMIFPKCEYCERYHTFDDAWKGHKRVVAALKKELKKEPKKPGKTIHFR